MSNTTRYVQRSWMITYGNVDLLYERFASVKHWAKDRPPWGRPTHSRGRLARRFPFSKYAPNDKYKLQRRIESRAFEEHCNVLFDD